MKPTIYIETTVVSLLTARTSKHPISAARQALTRTWWETIRPHFDLFISPVVLEEAGKGDSIAAQARLDAMNEIPVLEAPSQLEDLAREYLAAIQLPERVAADAYHVAFAAFHNLDFLLTWNCSHIANGFVRQKIEQINSRNGISTPIICTPEELMELPS